MNLKHVEAFYWLCRLGTYQRVADRLNLTQPAVSARIRALEDQLRADLVDRSQTRFALTERGQDVLVLAERMLDQRTRMMSRSGGAAQADRVRIAAVSLTLRTWMPSMLRRLAEIWPDTPVDVVSASDHQLTRYLPTAEIDIAFLSNVAPQTPLPRLFTVAYEVRWVAHPKIGACGSTSVTNADLASLPIVHYPRTSPLFPLTGGLDGTGTAPRHSANSLGTLLWMLRAGMGVAAIPAIAAADDLASGALTVLTAEQTPRPLKVRCAYARTARRGLTETLLDTAFASAADTAAAHPEWCSVVEGE